MKTKTKWYNDTDMVGALLLFFPPFGIYGLYKSETIESKWKRLTTGILVVVCVLLVMYYLT